MLLLLTAIFVIGYLCIALEHPLKVNKAGTALITAVVLWAIYMAMAPMLVPELYAAEFSAYVNSNPALAALTQAEQVRLFVHDDQIIKSLGETAEILFFLLGAMAVVELVDVHGGFNVITNRITTRDKRRLMWIIGFITFFMSAILDNLTTAIVMITLLRKIVANYKERWIYAGIIIIAANAGGAWSPIGDVTTIMLWVRNNISAGPLMGSLFLPSFVSFLVPTFFATRWLHGDLTSAPRAAVATSADTTDSSGKVIITRRERISILLLGVGGLISVPIFKGLTHLPPFMGILLVLGLLWVYTEIMYRRQPIQPARVQARVPYVLRKVDTPTILFFLGILMAVSALQASGILSNVSQWLDDTIHNVYAINMLIGGLSSVVDNVPLVAASIATYDVLDPAMIQAAADPAYAAAFAQDGIFWHFLAYCAGTGGSILIIGSAAGVVIMGLEHMSFGWYMRNITLIALAGYLAGAAVYILQQLIF